MPHYPFIIWVKQNWANIIVNYYNVLRQTFPDIIIHTYFPDNYPYIMYIEKSLRIAIYPVRISDNILKTRKYLNLLIKYNSCLKIHQALQSDGSIGQMTNNMQVKTWSKLRVHLNCFHTDYPITSTPMWALKLKAMCPITTKKAKSDFKYLFPNSLRSSKTHPTLGYSRKVAF